MKKSELKALIREVIMETHIHQAMTDMVSRDARKQKEQEYKSKLEKYYQAAKGHWPEKREYENDVRSAGKSLGYSESQIHNDLNRYTKLEDEPVMNNFIFESKLKALTGEVVEEMAAKKAPQNTMSEKAVLEDFLSSLKKKYPNIYAELEETEDYPQIPNQYRVVIGSDFSVQLNRSPNGNILLKKGNPSFYLDAAWLDDEQGKRNLTKDEMINAIGTLPDAVD